MSLLSYIKEQIGGNAVSSPESNQQGDLLQAISGLISNSGGLSGLLSKFHQNGLGQQVQSWVGKGENMPITGEQVQRVIGADQAQQVAEQTGTDRSSASDLIARVLPNLIDKITPEGKQVSDSEAHQGLSMLLARGLGSFLGAK